MTESENFNIDINDLEKGEQEKMVRFIKDFNSFVEILYSDVDYKDDVLVTQRSASEYKRTLCLSQIPLKVDAHVLDIGSGNADIDSQTFGLMDNNLIRADFKPRNPQILSANLLDLPFDGESFDETWLMFVLKYIDQRIPNEVSTKIDKLAVKLEVASTIDFARRIRIILGLKAIGEAIRVVKKGGKVRIGSYLYDFRQSEAMGVLIQSLSNIELSGLKVSTEEISGNSENEDRKEANLIIEKTENFNQNDFWKFLLQEAQRILPNIKRIFDAAKNN